VLAVVLARVVSVIRRYEAHDARSSG